MTKILTFADGFSSVSAPSIESITKADIGLGNVDNTSDANKPVSTATQTALNLKLNTSLKGASNGLAELDSSGKVPITQLPSSFMEYKGVYNASTNTPTLANGTGDIGDVYKVTVAGAGVNSLNFVVGDYAIYNGSVWEKAHSGADAVQSVNSQTGAVVLVKSDVGLANVPNVDATNPANITQTSSYRFATDAEKTAWNGSAIYQDTYANLLTWVATAADSRLAFSTDTKLLFYVATNTLQEVDVMKVINGTITTAQKTVGTTAVRATVSGSAPSTSRKKLTLKPSKNNTGSIFYGGSTVTTATGTEIIGPDGVYLDWDASDYYLISDTVGQTVHVQEVV